MCKWIVRAMEPGDSNLKLILRYRLAKFNSQRGKKWGVSLDWFTSKIHQEFTGSKIWGHIRKALKFMRKGVYQIPPRTKVELLHSNLWWSEEVKLLQKKFTNVKGLYIYCQGSKCVGDI